MRSLGVITLAAMILLSVPACGGNGGSSYVDWCFGLPSCSSGGPSTPTVTGGQSDSSFNDQTVDLRSGNLQNGGIQWNCGGAPSNTAFGTYTFNYSDGTSTYGNTAYWPSSGSYYLYAGVWNQNTPWNLSSTQTTLFGEAVTAWTNALDAEDSNLDGGGLNLKLVEQDNNNNAQVQIFGPTDNPGYPADTSVFVVPNNGVINVSSARINLHEGNISGAGNGFVYDALLHEMGHALGLKHNPDSGSVMFPSVDDSDAAEGCYPEKAQPVVQDVYNLVHQYDPTIRNAQIAARLGSGGCKRAPCPLSIRQHFYKRAFGQYANNAIILRDRSEAWRKMQRHGFWLHADDPMGANNWSTETLALSSTLVVQGTVGKTVGYVNLGGEAFVIRQLRVDQIFKHLLGPDKSRRVGDTILFADAVMPNSQYWMDDKPLFQGLHPVLFLRRTSYPSPLSRFGLTYETTAPMISKWFVDQSLHMHPMGSIRSRAARELGGQTIGTLMRRAASQYRFAALSEEAVLRSVLAGRGMRTESAVRQYEQLMMTHQTRIAAWARRTQFKSSVR